MTLQEIYDHLKANYSAHFPDDGLDDSGREGRSSSSGGWGVQTQPPFLIFFSFPDMD